MTAKDAPPLGARHSEPGSGRSASAHEAARVRPSGFDGFDDDPDHAKEFDTGNPDDMPDYGAAPTPKPVRFADSGMDGLDDAAR